MADPFTLPGTESLCLRRGGNGNAYRIDIALPRGEPSEAGWPSIWLLDGGGCFATCVEALRRMSRRTDATGVAPLVVVAVSAAGGGYDVAQRQRDFTTARTGAATGDAGTGGAEAFLDFLTGDVARAAAGRAPLDPERRTLFGHSLAGYFALWVLCHRSAAFRNYAAISPSIWWDRDGLLDAVEGLRGSGRRLFLAVGEWEEALPPWQVGLAGSADALARRTSRRMVANTREFGDRLGDVLGRDDARFALLAEEDHASIVSAAMPRALRLASRV